MGLREHQVAPFKSLVEILKRFPSAVDWSDMGTGKTYVAAAVAKALGLPTLVIGPAVSRTNWTEAAAAFGDTVSFTGYEELATGHTPYGWWDRPDTARTVYYQCTNCQCKFQAGETLPACYCHPQGIHCLSTRKKSALRGLFHFHNNVKLTIFDEVHRCSGLDTLNQKMLIAARRENKKILVLSATAASSPLHFRGLGYALDLHRLGDFYDWAGRFGCRRIPGAGLKWMLGEAKQLEVMATLRSQIIPRRGVRVTAESIPGFPECSIDPQLYDLGSSGRISDLYVEMAEALSALKTHSYTDTDPEHPLTKRLRAREEIELLKVPLAVELALDYEAQGYSVVSFLNFSSSLKAFAEKVGTHSIIDGSITGDKRAGVVRAFQSNESRHLATNTKVGGVSLSFQDLDGNHPRIGLVMPSESAIDMRQVFGRLPRVGGKSRSHYKILLAANTPDVKIHRAFLQKSGNIDALNDADLRPEMGA